MVDVYNMLINMFSRLFQYLDVLFTKLGAWSYVLGFFLIFTIYRLILAPVLGGVLASGRSDIVKKVRSDRNVKAVSGLKKGE